MESNRGVTITSLIIYVIAMLLVVGIISTITSFFYTNIMNVEDSSANISEMTKFNMHFLQEVKTSNNEIVQLNDNSIIFSTGNVFTLQDNSIYLNNIRICENVKNLQFSTEENNNKQIITVLVTIGENIEFTKTTRYVMANM